jgi:CHAT domain-containing protein
MRSYAHWKAGRRNEALTDLRQAIEQAEQQRFHTSGAEVERATAFGWYREAFEAMVAFQVELGDVDQAFAAIERSRARSMLDEMAVSRADLEVGRSLEQRERLRRQEEELQGQIGGLQARIERFQGDPHRTAAEKTARFRELQTELDAVRGRLYEHYRDARTSSPVYRQLLSASGSVPDPGQLRKRLISDDDLLLAYLFGDLGGYVVTISGQQGRIASLQVDAAAAKILQIDAGSLTSARLERALVGSQGTGVLEQLRDPQKALQATDRLAALWQLLVPGPERKALIEGKVKRLIVLPDGPLALLPLETLVIQLGAKPRYLLDLDVAVLYAPSATVLDNLTQRPAKTLSADQEPVLTVGNPDYETAPSQASSDATALVLAPSRYGALGGKLAPLPYSGWESQWVAEAFGGQSLKSVRLEGAQATEANVRARMPGRRIVHLACHGLADQAYGNLFGALAFTPGPNRADPADDGFLILAETYRLNLAGTELAILSACDTNYGPQQRGEGVWTLSRGFLVAGCRRVVASSWLVDDEAAASTMSHFCRSLAAAEKAQGPSDYASALRRAKQLVRQQEKWKSPFYWGTFVLVGP